MGITERDIVKAWELAHCTCEGNEPVCEAQVQISLALEDMVTEAYVEGLIEGALRD